MRFHEIKNKAAQLSNLKNAGELAVLLKTHPSSLALLGLHPQYKTYNIPKKNGKFRLIEDPEKKLKTVQRTLNNYLQAWYYTVKPAAVHGFCISAGNEEPIGILSNARAHLGKPFLLNMDFQDYFHQLSAQEVNRNLGRVFKKNDTEIVTTLVNLTTYKERLPMGAPTSPILANICTLELDAVLMNICTRTGITYTRFADDLSFSSLQPITKTDCEMIETAIIGQGFDINHGKTKNYAAQDTKMVTGLVLGNNDITLPPQYIPQLLHEMERYKTIQEVEYRYQTGMSNKKLKLFEQELAGKLNFAETVLGSTHTALKPVYEQWTAATAPLENFESADWLEIPYEFF
jgi:RNA-directed DNA polymerase